MSTVAPGQGGRCSYYAGVQAVKIPVVAAVSHGLQDHRYSQLLDTVIDVPVAQVVQVSTSSVAPCIWQSLVRCSVFACGVQDGGYSWEMSPGLVSVFITPWFYSGYVFGVSLRGFLEEFHTFHTCKWPRIASARWSGRSEEGNFRLIFEAFSHSVQEDVCARWRGRMSLTSRPHHHHHQPFFSFLFCFFVFSSFCFFFFSGFFVSPLFHFFSRMGENSNHRIFNFKNQTLTSNFHLRISNHEL